MQTRNLTFGQALISRDARLAMAKTRIGLADGALNRPFPHQPELHNNNIVELVEKELNKDIVIRHGIYEGQEGLEIGLTPHQKEAEGDVANIFLSENYFMPLTPETDAADLRISIAEVITRHMLSLQDALRSFYKQAFNTPLNPA